MMRNLRNVSWLIAAACALSLSACQTGEIVIIDPDDDFYNYPPPPPGDCVLDIRVDERGQTFWKGEAISNEEFDLRLRSGRIDEACVEPAQDVQN